MSILVPTEVFAVRTNSLTLLWTPTAQVNSGGTGPCRPRGIEDFLDDLAAEVPLEELTHRHGVQFLE